MRERHEYFGDPEFVSDELVPLSGGKRGLRLKTLATLFGAVAVVPATYGFAVSNAPLGLLGALLALGCGVAVAGLAAWLLTPSSVRYGVGFTLLCRAVLGPRGAPLLLLLRWWVGVVFVAAWALETASWTRKLLVAFSEANQLEPLRPLLTYELQGVETTPATWLIAALLLLFAYGIARQPVSAIAGWALGSGIIALLVGCALVVFAGIQSRGFGSWIERESVLQPQQVAVVACVAALMVWPALMSAADWVRFAPGEGAGRLVRPLGALAALVPVALLLAFFGALIASASLVLRGSMDGHPIPDATGYGGMLAGGGAVLLAVALFAVGAPLVGFYSPGLALAGMVPRRVSLGGGLGITLVVSVVCVPLISQLDAAQLGLDRWLLLLATPGALLLADALVVRRGRMVIDELYCGSSDYGPLFGISLAGLFALAVGWMFHPTIWRLSFAEPLNWPLARAGKQGFSSDELAITAIGAVLAAATYLLLAVFERRLTPQLLTFADDQRTRLAAWRQRRQREHQRRAAIAERKARRETDEAALEVPMPLDDEDTPIDPPDSA